MHSDSVSACVPTNVDVDLPFSVDDDPRRRKSRILGRRQCGAAEAPMDNESPFPDREEEIPSQRFPKTEFELF